MSRLDNDELKEVLEAIDPEHLLDREGITHRVTHGSSGTQLNIKTCPTCGNSHWKVYMNAESGVGNCFAGDHPEDSRTFNLFSFTREALGLAGRETVEYLKRVAAESGWRSRRTVSAAVNYDASELVLPKSFEIPHEGRNLRYLEQRGIDTETAKYFHLRYCEKGWFKYQIEGQERFQRYHGRVIIPVFDLDGVLVSFQGRDVTGTAEQKYLFPPGYSSTGRYLYNGHNAHRAERVVVGEGAFDVMATKVALDEDAALRDVVPVGTFGKHLSYGSIDGKDQLGAFIELREGGLKEVTFMWDGEPLALKAAAESGTLLKQRGLAVRIAILPPGKDPNEVPPNVVREAYWKAQLLTNALLVKLRLGASVS